MTVDNKNEKSYEDMLEEVELLMEELQMGEIGLDKVISKVERGFAILTDLRDRLDKMSLKINQIKENFHKSPPTSSNS